MSGKVLIVDDDPTIRKGFGLLLESGGALTVSAVDCGAGALALLASESCDVVLLDFSMPDMDGLAVLREIRRLYPDLPVIMVTGRGDVSLAVEAIKLGAYDYLPKPPDPDHLLLLVGRALEKRRLEDEVRRLDRSLASSLESQLGRSPAIRQIIEDIRRIAVSDFSLIIEGETGTGKTFIASLVHSLSPRAKGPFVALDIGTIPESLVESELFGYEKGAFTGADRRKKGYFELAQGGTLLLDELQNLSVSAQAKLLQVVEEKRFQPVGASKPLVADLRIIGATNADLEQAVLERSFRRDLYFRLNEYSIELPPLRQRTEDIPLLATRLLTEAAAELGRNLSGPNEEALALLVAEDWPGNIRELKNVLRRAAILSEGGEVTAALLKRAMGRTGEGAGSAGLAGRQERRGARPDQAAPPISLDQAESAAIENALSHTGGNRTRAAAILGITHKTLLAKIKKYGL